MTAADLATQASALSLAREQQLFHTAQLWMRGNSVFAISLEQGREQVEVIRDIRLMRGRMAKWQDSDLREIAAERITALRQIIAEAWRMQDTYPTARILTVIHRVEATIGRIQGVLSDKVMHLHGGTVKLKLYDFTDKFPEIGDGAVIKGALVEAVKADEAIADPLHDADVVIDLADGGI